MSADARAEPRIEAMQNAYHLGYLAEEVRVTYKKDVKMTVGSVAIDAKEGDMSSLQRWVAKILVEQGAVEVQSNESAGYISRAMNRERIAKAHKGSREGVHVAELIAGKHPHPIKYDNVPSVTYCHPEVASIGLTEDQCKERKLEYQVGRFPLSANGRARAANETDGFVKIIRDKKYGEILGAHIVASHASELIHELTVARENEYTVEEVDLAIHAHPTLSEAIAEAALDSMGRVVHI